jgi:benzoate membrane transport protein
MISAATAALVAILAGYSGSLVIIFQAAQAAHLTAGQLSSWIWAISLSCGLCSAGLSYAYRAPIAIAWSTPGAALLVVALPTMPYAEAIGAYVMAAAALLIIALTGLFDRAMRLVPPGIAAAMLAGILFRFGADLFTSAGQEPALVGVMLAIWLIARRLTPRFAITATLALGVLLALLRGQTHFAHVTASLAVPEFTMPVFTLAAAINLAVPLILVAISAQYIPGLAVLRAAGYAPPARALVAVSSAASLLFAPFGSHGITTAAITAALIANEEAHPDKTRRWIAGVWIGGFKVIIALFGATVAALFAALPAALIAAIAGMALTGAILAGLSAAVTNPNERDAAILTFLCAASGMSAFGIGAAFWGLVIGLAAQFAFSNRRST